jgi:radical SAM protein with 4Fe4S-binding SPASM domain
VPASSAEDLCRAALAGLGEGSSRPGWPRELATVEPRLVGFAHLLAAQAAADSADWAAALRHAKAAVAADQQDTYAQVLFGQALAALDGGGGGQAADGGDLRERFCARPFQELEIRADGSVYTCCSAWLPVPIGDIGRTPLGEIWNSTAAREIRRSVLDGDYRHCSRLYCPALAGGSCPGGRRSATRSCAG